MVEHPQKWLDGRILYGVIDGGRRIEKQNGRPKYAATKDGHSCSVHNRKCNQERNGHYTQQNPYAMSNTIGKFLLKRLWPFCFSCHCLVSSIKNKEKKKIGHGLFMSDGLTITRNPITQ